MHLTTSRLLLREFRPADLDALFALYGDPTYQRYEEPPLSREKTQARLEGFLADAAVQPRTRFRLAITLPPADTVIGKISLGAINPSIGEWEIGWGVAPRFWGQGYAPEAARAMLAYAFDTLNARRVVAFCHFENVRSQRVMEKIGMQREGRPRQVRWLDDRWNDEYIYGILRQEFSDR